MKAVCRCGARMVPGSSPRASSALPKPPGENQYLYAVTCPDCRTVGPPVWAGDGALGCLEAVRAWCALDSPRMVPAKKQVGRPPLVGEFGEEVVTGIRTYGLWKLAAELAGVSRKAVSNWQAKGEEALRKIEAGGEVDEREMSYAQFLLDATHARAEYLAEDLKLARGEAAVSPQLRKYLLTTIGRDYGLGEVQEVQVRDLDLTARRAAAAARTDDEAQTDAEMLAEAAGGSAE